MLRVRARTLLSRHSLPRCIHTTPFLKSDSPSKPSHTADSYFKDVDSSPPSDSTIHRVDANSSAVQRPHDPPAGAYSETGAESSAYVNVSKEEPYKARGEEGKGKAKYGAKGGEPATSPPEDGPHAKSSGGRKPEGR